MRSARREATLLIGALCSAVSGGAAACAPAAGGEAVAPPGGAPPLARGMQPGSSEPSASERASAAVHGVAPARPGDAARADGQRHCDALPQRAANQLRAALASARPHARHVWRDLTPFNADGTLNAYVEIPVGERRKWEFDIAANELRLDRTIDASVGGYPINYGFVPQTVSCDGDPFDVLVLGPPIAEGTVVSGEIVGVMYMNDEKGPDAKVIIARRPQPSPGAAPLALEGAREVPSGLSGERSRVTPAKEAELQRWFDAYKKADAEQGRWSAVLGFGSAAEGRGLVESTHAFFTAGRDGARP